MKFTLDFIASTNGRYLATEHKKGTSLALAKNAFNALSHFLHVKTDQGVFPCAVGEVTSLGPFGIRNALEGLKIAPKFLCQHAWSSVLFDAVNGSDSTLESLSSLPVEKVLSPLHRPYAPLRNAFLRAFPSPLLGRNPPPPPPSFPYGNTALELFLGLLAGWLHVHSCIVTFNPVIIPFVVVSS